MKKRKITRSTYKKRKSKKQKLKEQIENQIKKIESRIRGEKIRRNAAEKKKKEIQKIIDTNIQRRQEQDNPFLHSFFSFVPPSEKMKNKKYSYYLTETEARQQGLQLVLDGGNLYINPKKLLYIKVDNHFLNLI